MMKKIFAAFILLLSLNVLSLALFRLIASLNYIPVSVALDNISALDDNKLNDILKTAQLSLAFNKNTRYQQDLGSIFISLAQKDLFKQRNRYDLKQADYFISQALLNSPANAKLWYQLALIRLLSQADNKNSLKLLFMSVMLGRYEFEYFMPRLNLCLLLFSDITNDDDKNLIRQQVITAWKVAPQLLLTYIRLNKKLINPLTALLKDNHVDILQAILIAVDKT